MAPVDRHPDFSVIPFFDPASRAAASVAGAVPSSVRAGALLVSALR
jgi:hypothetical protein